MDTELKQKLEELFEDAKSYKFSKDEYKATFQRAYGEYEAVFEQIAIICGESKERITEFAAVLPALLKSELVKLTAKRKKEALQMEYNTVMVTYIIPLLGNYSKNGTLDLLIEELIKQWNEVGTGTMPIGRASFGEIQGGFKSRFCYITTAVCKNLQETDDCYELNLLRNYRDTYLLKEKDGAELVERYYDIAPTIVKRIERETDANSIYKNIWQTYLKPCVNYIEEKNYTSCKTLYTKMVRELQHTYIVGEL